MTLWLQLTGGRGPAECCLAVAGVMRRLVEEAARDGLRAHVLEASEGPVPRSLSSALVAIDGDEAERFARTWEGTVRWIAQSPIRPHHRRKNWFVAVSVFSASREEEHALDLRDLEITALRAGGPGGQHVNKTASAVRVVHRPSGLVVVGREERSQHRNRALALARLQAALDDRRRDDERAEEQARWRGHDALERGRAVRTFVGEGFVPR